MVRPDVAFFVPRQEWPPTLPASAAEYWSWVLEQGQEYSSGRYVVTVRTYLHLREAGFPCELVDEVPGDGIVITHSDFLPFAPGRSDQDVEAPWTRRPRFEDWLGSTFVVAFQGDRPRNPYPEILLVQNAHDVAVNGRSVRSRLMGLKLHHIPFWNQPGLRPRDPERGDRFETVAFFGNPFELDPALRGPEWARALDDMGLKWSMPCPAAWNDYRSVDAVVAARQFDYPGGWLWKPATKLFNAWLAGVPAVVGPESAYRAERRSDLDFLEASTPAEAASALARLRDDPALRQSMVDNGHRRTPEVSDEGFTRRWRRFIEDDAIPAYQRWRQWPPFIRGLRRSRRVAGIGMEAAVRPLGKAVGRVRGASPDLFEHKGDWN